MKTIAKLCCILFTLHCAIPAVLAQSTGSDRLRELRMKSRDGTLTPEEKAELDKAMQARGGTGTSPSVPRPETKPEPGKPGMTPTPAPSSEKPPMSREEAARKKREAYGERQDFLLKRMREMGEAALAAAAGRKAPASPAREFFVNNETGDDSSTGLSADKAVKTLAKAVSLLQPGDTLHLAVTNQPYHETLRLGDNFGGVEGKPITIQGHGATLTGSDPLRLDGWVEAGMPGLYKSAKFLSELEEFTDEAKLMRVYFIFDGVMQHMGRSSKGSHSRLKAVSDLQPGEWTYVEAEKSFYLKVTGKLADAKIEAPYRRNGVTIRSPKVALTHVVIQDLIVCHVLNDGWNLHGTTQNLLLKNIAAYECGDDGISPHDTCEATIDALWSVGNSTGMANGNLSVTKARNVRLENNTAQQFLAGHAPVTELSNAIIIGSDTNLEPFKIFNAQDARTTFENVQISAPGSKKLSNAVSSHFIAKRLTCDGPAWENGGTIKVQDSRITGQVVNFAGGTWAGEKNGKGADTTLFQIPPRPVPHPAAGKFMTLK
jgi:hypothetical protein